MKNTEYNISISEDNIFAGRGTLTYRRGLSVSRPSSPIALRSLPLATQSMRGLSWPSSAWLSPEMGASRGMASPTHGR
jgi:hypothetical protein